MGDCVENLEPKTRNRIRAQFYDNLYTTFEIILEFLITLFNF
jgi:hypothetical protein